MESQYAADNLSHCALGYFPLGGNDSNMRLRGVMALKPIKKGDPIIQITYELAVNLGQEGADPTIPAVTLLKDYCKTLSSLDNQDTNKNNNKAAYYHKLPPF
jgi:hypothetical protein